MSNTRTAIVTGAARGIGAAVARRLAHDGLAVAVLDLHEAACKPVVEEIQAAGGHSIAVGADVADEALSRPPSNGSPLSLAPRPCWSTTPASLRDNLLFKMTTRTGTP